MKMKLRLPIKTGKTYYTKNDKKVRIYATDGGSAYPIHGAWLNKDNIWTVLSWDTHGHTNRIKATEDLDITHEEWEPQDKELVWAWDDFMDFRKHVGFYDAKNNCLFCPVNGIRNGQTYDHYAPYEYEWPTWAKEAYERLEA